MGPNLAEQAADTQPLVSIGVPVFNEAATVERAVSCLLAQTYENLEIIISDNASTDGTAEIAEAIAAADDRVRCVVHQAGLGPAGNFRFVLEEATGEFFMWAAGDDTWEPPFIEENLRSLVEDEGLVCSTSRVQWIIDGVPSGLAAGTAPLSGSESRNVAQYLRVARDNSRFYGLFRRDALVASFPDQEFLALDHAVMLGTLRFGRHGEVGDVLMSRRRNAPESYAQGPDGGAWFPLLPFTRYVVREARIPLTPVTVGLLVVRNMYEHLRTAALRESLYGRFARQALRLAGPTQRALTTQ